MKRAQRNKVLAYKGVIKMIRHGDFVFCPDTYSIYKVWVVLEETFVDCSGAIRSAKDYKKLRI